MEPDHKRIALFSDIHANFPALQAVLAYCDTNTTIDLIINLGDLVGIGPHPQEVFDLVINDSRFVNIMGNHEKCIWQPQPCQIRSEELNHFKWVNTILGSDRMQKLNEFPLTQNLNVANYSLFILHSRRPPANVDELPLLFQGKSISEFRKDYPISVDFVIFGHIHQQFLLQDSTPIFICPGSVGCANMSTAVASFAILELSPSKWNVEFIQVPYDLTKILNDFEKRNVPDRLFIQQKFYKDKLNLI